MIVQPTQEQLTGELGAFWKSIAEIDRRLAERDEHLERLGFEAKRPKLTLVQGGKDAS